MKRELSIVSSGPQNVLPMSNLIRKVTAALKRKFGNNMIHITHPRMFNGTITFDIS